VLLNKAGGVKLFNLFGRFSLIFILVFTFVNAKTFEHFKKSQDDTYSTYTDKRDIEFSKHLKQQFKAYGALEITPLYEKQKPTILPTTNSIRIKQAGPIIKINVTSPVNLQEKNSNKKIKEKDINVDFFGSSIGFNIPSKIMLSKYYPQNQKGINNFFDMLASSAYDDLLSQIESVCKDKELNDWAIYLLVKKLSDLVFTNSDDSKLLSWFLFSKMGYDVKIALFNKHIVLLHYSEKIIYMTQSYKFEDKIYYLIAEKNTIKLPRVYSYKQSYPDANKPLDLELNSLPKLTMQELQKGVKFKYKGNEYDFKISFNKNILDFMDTYPLANFSTFFNAPMEDKTYIDVAKFLKKHIDGKQASWAINFVLNFVQNAFIYDGDNKQFGNEKVMFAEQVLYYDKSDCDDRSVLFSYLIKKLFSFSIIGLKYDNHMSTALYIPMEGDSVKYKSKKYLIADPSYKNASIGQVIPRYKSIKPQEFIEIKNN